MTLNATKRRLLHAGQNDRALMVQRFQNISDYPYVYLSGAAAVLTDSAYDEELIQESTKVAGHQNSGNIELIVIRGKELMKLVHALYERAANEAWVQQPSIVRYYPIEGKDVRTWTTRGFAYRCPSE
jgi:hypothetical protein